MMWGPPLGGKVAAPVGGMDQGGSSSHIPAAQQPAACRWWRSGLFLRLLWVGPAQVCGVWWMLWLHIRRFKAHATTINAGGCVFVRHGEARMGARLYKAESRLRSRRRAARGWCPAIRRRGCCCPPAVNLGHVQQHLPRTVGVCMGKGCSHTAGSYTTLHTAGNPTSAPAAPLHRTTARAQRSPYLERMTARPCRQQRRLQLPQLRQRPAQRCLHTRAQGMGEPGPPCTKLTVQPIQAHSARSHLAEAIQQAAGPWRGRGRCRRLPVQHRRQAAGLPEPGAGPPGARHPSCGAAQPTPWPIGFQAAPFRPCSPPAPSATQSPSHQRPPPQPRSPGGVGCGARPPPAAAAATAATAAAPGAAGARAHSFQQPASSAAGALGRAASHCRLGRPAALSPRDAPSARASAPPSCSGGGAGQVRSTITPAPRRRAHRQGPPPRPPPDGERAGLAGRAAKAPPQPATAAHLCRRNAVSALRFCCLSARHSQACCSQWFAWVAKRTRLGVIVQLCSSDRAVIRRLPAWYPPCNARCALPLSPPPPHLFQHGFS